MIEFLNSINDGQEKEKIVNLYLNEDRTIFNLKFEIKAIIHSYYMSIGVQEKFKKLNSNLDAKQDSLKLQKKYFEKEIKKDKRIIDSLKNN